MFELASPIWLWSGLAALLPLALHLLSQGQRRRVRVGSVKLLQAARSRRFRRLRLHDVPLMLLRAGLLALVALLLARPQGLAVPEPGGRGAVLVEPELLARRPALEREQPRLFAELDALAAEGRELRLIGPGLPAARAGAEPASGGPPENVWSYLREADRLTPSGATLWVFTLDRLAGLRGTRPALRSAVEWRAAAGSGETRWLQRAPTPGPEPEARGPSVPATLAHSARRAEDARLVRAALAAAAQAAGVDLAVQLKAAETWDAAQGSGLAFWLAEAPVPAALRAQVEHGLVLVRDTESERFEEVRSRIVLDRLLPSAGPRLFRRSTEEALGLVHWRDGFGRPVLESRGRGSGVEVVYHSRFDPSWSELVLHPAFPEGLLDLVVRAAGREPAPEPDGRGVSATQRQPRRSEGPGAPARPPEPRAADLSLGLLALGLFAAERWRSARRPL
jgi:hypothetical protein